MGMNVANEFTNNWQQIQPMPPNNEHAGLVANGPVDFSAQAPPETKADVGIKVAANHDVSPAHVAGSAMIAGQTLRDPGITPKGDINFACSSLADTAREAVVGLFGALKSKEPEVSIDEPQMAMAAPPPRPQAATFNL